MFQRQLLFLSLLYLNQGTDLVMCSIYNLTVEEGQSLTLECTYYDSTMWFVTERNTRRLVTICNRNNQCTNLYGNYNVSAVNDTRGSYFSHLSSSLTRKVSYLQVPQAYIDLNRIDCSDNTWNIVAYDRRTEITLMANQINGSITVYPDSQVTFTCLSSRVTQIPLTLYKDNIYVTQTISQYLIYTMFIDNTDSFLFKCSMGSLIATVYVDVRQSRKQSENKYVNSSSHDVLIGVSLGGGAFIFLTICTIVVRHKRKKHYSRVRERHTVTHPSPSFLSNTCQTSDTRPHSFYLSGGRRWTRRPLSLNMDSGYCSEPPRYDEIFYTDNSLQSDIQSPVVPPQDFTPILPSYDEVVNFYKNN